MSEKDQAFADVYNDIATYPTLADVANKLNMAYKTVKNTAGVLRHKRLTGDLSVPELISRRGTAAAPVSDAGKPVSLPSLPEYEEPIEELLERAMRHNERVAAFTVAKKLIDVRVNTPGPIGIVGLPDPHLNNTGTLLREAMRHAYLIRDTEGLFAVGVGDWLDNFIIGRLERERRKDIMTHSDAGRIQEHFVLSMADKLLAAVGGNHNDWVESLGGTDVLKGLFKQAGLAAIYDTDEVRVRINLPDGSTFTHLVRHIFPGHSKYNSMHGILAWMLDRWQGEDVLWGGHIHSAGSMSIEREWEGKSRVVRGVQLAAYKDVDGYAKKGGFRRNVPFLVPMVIHDPETGKSHLFEDFDYGLRVLNTMRHEWLAKAK